MIQPEYRTFARLAHLHRRLIGQVDQKVGHEKHIMRKYISAIDKRLTNDPRARAYFAQWRRDQGMSSRTDDE